jgi:polyhydroxyalkanoate synthesis regulator phasin
MHEHRHRIFGMDHLRHEFIGTQSSPEDEACSRSQQERVAAFTPLSDRSLVVLATEIEDLKAHIEDMNKQHVEEVGELITENKHLQEHIRKIQDELEHSREMSVLHTNHHEERLAELEQHIRNLEAEIGRR